MHKMAQTHEEAHNPMTFARLMRLGQVAHAQGNDRMAHDYWKQAAMLEPANEQVWTALMWVLDDDDDRKICLKNILTINPRNYQAQKMLDELIGETQPQEDPIVADVNPEEIDSIDYVRVLVLGTVVGSGTAIIIVMLQMLVA